MPDTAMPPLLMSRVGLELLNAFRTKIGTQHHKLITGERNVLTLDVENEAKENIGTLIMAIQKEGVYPEGERGPISLGINLTIRNQLYIGYRTCVIEMPFSLGMVYQEKAKTFTDNQKDQLFIHLVNFRNELCEPLIRPEIDSWTYSHQNSRLTGKFREAYAEKKEIDPHLIMT